MVNGTCLPILSLYINREEYNLKTLALIGSPRKHGNTDIMADEVLRGVSDSNSTICKLYLDDYTIRPIAETCDIIPERQDIRSDDDFPKLLEVFLDSDIIILSTPVYWQGLSAQLKCFLDRMSSYWRRPPYAERFDGKGYIVLCAYGRPEEIHGTWVTEPTKLTVGVLRGYYLGDVCAPNTFQKGRVRQYPDVLEACYKIGHEAPEKLSMLRKQNVKAW